MSRKIPKIRFDAFQRQGGNCYYCGQPMWLSHAKQFAKQHRITQVEAKKHRCTAEHLIARQDGGTNTSSNIVAACVYCNSRRHRTSEALDPPEYQIHVQKCLLRGEWHL